MNKYICLYKGKKFEISADTSYSAQKICAQENRIKKSYEITVVLAEKNGTTVIHDPAEF